MSQEAVAGEKRERLPGESIRITGLTAGLAALFLLLRLLAVSRWNWHTATDVLDSVNVSDAVTIIFGTLFAVPVATGLLVACLLPLAIYDLVVLRDRAEWRFGHLLLVVALIVITVSLVETFSAWWLPLVVLAVTAAIWIQARLWRHDRGRTFISAAARGVGTAALVVLMVLAAVVTTPWTPEERIVTRTGSIEGYVLEVQPGFLRVLTADSRRMVTVVSSNVEAREPLP